MEPLVFAAEARGGHVDGVVAIERFTSTSVGDRVLFAGDTLGALRGAHQRGAWPSLARRAERVWGGEDAPPLAEAAVVGGVLRVAGRDVADASHLRIAGAAPLDPPLPPSYNAEEYVGWSARPRRCIEARRQGARGERAGWPRPDSRASGDARSRPSTSPLSGAPWSSLQAIVMSPEVLIAESPLAGLDGARGLRARGRGGRDGGARRDHSSTTRASIPPRPRARSRAAHDPRHRPRRGGENRVRRRAARPLRRSAAGAPRRPRERPGVEGRARRARGIDLHAAGPRALLGRAPRRRDDARFASSLRARPTRRSSSSSRSSADPQNE